MKKARFIFWKAVHVYLAWIAVNGSAGALNVMVAMAVLMILSGAGLMTTRGASLARKTSSRWEMRLSYLIDGPIGAFMIWYGHFFIGGAFMWVAFAYTAIAEEYDKN